MQARICAGDWVSMWACVCISVQVHRFSVWCFGASHRISPPSHRQFFTMGKSLRSKSKLRAKSVKRNGEFAKHVDARNERLAAKLKEKTQSQAESQAEKSPNDTDKPKLEKISTSGWRDSRKLQYKQRQLKKKKNVTKF